MEFRYNAFISYRHSELDMFVAKKIHKGLETFKVPGPVAKATGIKKISRVFRDQEELPIGSDLGDNITAAIKDTEFLIVICSPRTPQSEWVQKEIDSFISYHGRDHILAVLIEGEPGESFPQALLVDDEGNAVEPLAADVRGLNNKEVEKKLKTELLRLAAPILHCNYDDLRQRHRERRNKKIFTIVAATLSVLALLGLGFGIYYAHNAAVLKQALNDKEINHSKFLASTAQGLLEEGDREAAMLVAREALPQNNDKPYVAEAIYPLSQALDAYKLGVNYDYDRLLTCKFNIKEAVYDQTGQYITTIDEGNRVTVWSINSGKAVLEVDPYIHRITSNYKPVSADVIDEKLYVIGTDGLYQFDLAGNCLKSIESGVYAPFGKIDSINKKAAFENSGTLYFYDLTSMNPDWILEDCSDLYSEYAFDAEGKYLAISLNADAYKGGGIDVFNTSNGSSIRLKADQDYISRMRFMQNGDLAVVSSDNEILSLLGGEGHYTVEVFDVKTGKSKWTYEIPIEESYKSTNSLFLISRIYKEDDKEVNEVIVSANNSIYTIDGNSGELFAEVSALYVSNLLISASSSIGYVAQKNGNIVVMDLRDGSYYDTFKIETNVTISKALISNGVFALYNTASPSVTLLSQRTGPGLDTVEEFDESISDIQYSSDYSVMAVKTYSGSVFFYDAESGEKISSINIGEYNAETAFVDESTFIYIPADTSFNFYDAKSGKTNVISPSDKISRATVKIDTVTGKAYATDNVKMIVVDIKAQKVLLEKEGFAFRVDLANMYSYYYKEKDPTLYREDLNTGNVTAVEIKNDADEMNKDTSYQIDISPSGKYLAMVGTDQLVRIYNTESQTIEHSIQIPFTNTPFLQFSEDESKIYLEGDDEYFRVYDLTKGEIIFISKDRFPFLAKVTEAPEDNLYVLSSLHNLSLLDDDSQTLIASAEYGKVYDSKHKYVWSTYSKKLYRFKYMDLNALLEESEKQFPGAELTKEQRVKYFVD